MICDQFSQMCFMDFHFETPGMLRVHKKVHSVAWKMESPAPLHVNMPSQSGSSLWLGKINEVHCFLWYSTESNKSSKWMISYRHVYTWHVADVSHPLPFHSAHSKHNLLFSPPLVSSVSLGSLIWPGPVGHLGEQALITRAWWMDRWILGNRHNAHHIDASQLKEKQNKPWFSWTLQYMLRVDKGERGGG